MRGTADGHGARNPAAASRLGRETVVVLLLSVLASCASLDFGNSGVGSAIVQLLGLAILVWIVLLIV